MLFAVGAVGLLILWYAVEAAVNAFREPDQAARAAEDDREQFLATLDPDKYDVPRMRRRLERLDPKREAEKPSLIPIFVVAGGVRASSS